MGIDRREPLVWRAPVKLGSGVNTGGVELGPGALMIDTVAVQQADYFANRHELRVAATSTGFTATLQVYVSFTGQLNRHIEALRPETAVHLAGEPAEHYGSEQPVSVSDKNGDLEVALSRSAVVFGVCQESARWGRAIPHAVREMKEMEPLTKVAVLLLAAILLIPSSLFGQDGATVLTIDHLVPHVSTVPANAGELVRLFVRERVRESNGGSDNEPRKAILMLHGLSSPVLADYALTTDHYEWALWLAQSGGFDVFMLDFQGSGLSPRPKMDDPCNVPKVPPAFQQSSLLIPNPLSATCPPSYPFQLINSQSDWAELDTVVDYIRNLRGVDKVAIVSWSQGSFRAGPYAVQHPEKVESLFLYAPIYNPEFRSGTGPDGFGPPVARCHNPAGR